MQPALRSSRISRLQKRFLDVLSGSVKLEGPRDATLFLEGLCAQDDPVVCLIAITESAHGLSSVQSAMRFDLSIRFMNGLAVTVLDYLLRASNAAGDTLDDVLFHVVEPPTFWHFFTRALQQGTLSEDAQLVFAKVLSRLLTLQGRDTAPYRNVAARPSIQAALSASPKREVRVMGCHIKRLLSASSPDTLDGVLSGPGGRHDNDFVDFCNIAILPTADEILCQKLPFLHSAHDDEFNSSETPVKDHLDNTFRMLREDILFDIRQELKVALQKGGVYRGLRVNVSMVGIYAGTDDLKTRWAIKLQCNSEVWALKSMTDEDAWVQFLARDPHGSKILRHQSLVCLASGQDIISFGTVNRVEELLACKPPIIVLQLDSDVNIRKTLISLCTLSNVQLIQINTMTFVLEPVLSTLKKCWFSLSEEILFWDPSSPLEFCQSRIPLSHIVGALTSDPSAELKSLLNLPKCITLDKAQAKSLVAGLQQRLSLIQGPPGTGKSFMGALLAKAIHDETSQTILFVCLTNHALDQFLSNLLEYGIPEESIVHLGGHSNQSTDHLALHKQSRGWFAYNWDELNWLRHAASAHENNLQSHFRTLLNIDDKKVISYLEHEHHEFFKAFYVPLETRDGTSRVGEDGHAIDERYLFSRWTLGLDAGVLSGESHVQASTQIWGMVHSARQMLLEKWKNGLFTKEVESICCTGRLYNNLQDSIEMEFARSTLAILRQKRIIACTTTGAALYAEVLDRVGPEVLLVEEAGEILEGHIITALSHNVNQMILIGDHKQLRPRVNNYQLTVEKGDGFDLNRSLFERLVLKGYPHETLTTQHRMRPEISALVRELTYPKLVDAPSTNQRPNIRGVRSNVIFVDHTHPENEDLVIGDRADHGMNSSKQNTYEVQMVVKMVHYLAQQGYKSENIVVLTPYLGQLHKLRDALQGENDPVLNHMDSLHLARSGSSLLSPLDTKPKKSRIHLATIDNYQGEESDIVIASLTRSNKSNVIGFMDSPERLNVLLSRARDGLILIGNSQTFLHSKTGGSLWGQFFGLLEKDHYVYQGFPAKCERHLEHTMLLKSASDFDDHFPDGRCAQPCGFILACGHTCPLKCHSDRSSQVRNPHNTSQCKFRMSAICPKGQHKISWECCLGSPVCLACVEEAERLEEIAQQKHEAQERRKEAEAQKRLHVSELLRAERVAQERRKLQEEQEQDARMQEKLKRQEEEARNRKEEEKKKGEERVEQQEPCGFILACGHTCPLKYHQPSGLSNPHNASQCKFKMGAICLGGKHRITWECHVGQPSVCLACIKDAESLEETARQKREAQKRRKEVEAEVRRRVAEVLAVERADEERRGAKFREKHEARMREVRRREKETQRREEQKRREQEEWKREEEWKRMLRWIEERGVERLRQEELAAAKERERLSTTDSKPSSCTLQ